MYLNFAATTTAHKYPIKFIFEELLHYRDHTGHNSSKDGVGNSSLMSGALTTSVFPLIVWCILVFTSSNSLMLRLITLVSRIFMFFTNVAMLIVG